MSAGLDARAQGQGLSEVEGRQEMSEADLYSLVAIIAMPCGLLLAYLVEIATEKVIAWEERRFQRMLAEIRSQRAIDRENGKASWRERR